VSHSRITRLDPAEYGKVRDLFAGLEYNASIDSTLDGNTPGSVWVDDPQQPHAALIHTVECWALGGDPQHLEVWAQFIQEDLFPTDECDELNLRVNSAWESQIETLALRIGRETVYWPHRHYVCHHLALTNWAERMPGGFSVQYINAELLKRTDQRDLMAPQHLIYWVIRNWGTRENYVKRGFGTCIVDEGVQEIVSWSVADCTSENRCEIGIHTHPNYRRRGLASLTTAAAVAHALTHGFSEVGWHCDEQNAGSIGTAEKAGFILERKYTARIYMSDAGEHLTLQGYRALLNGDLQTSATAYKRALALRENYPYWTYFTAARAYASFGDLDSAIVALGRAAELGESRVDLLRETPEFTLLHKNEAWAGIVQRIQENRRSSQP
jgi:RimJ/RimL family protein N-acetyltransferase